MVFAIAASVANGNLPWCLPIWQCQNMRYVLVSVNTLLCCVPPCSSCTFTSVLFNLYAPSSCHLLHVTIFTCICLCSTTQMCTVVRRFLCVARHTCTVLLLLGLLLLRLHSIHVLRSQSIHVCCCCTQLIVCLCSTTQCVRLRSCVKHLLFAKARRFPFVLLVIHCGVVVVSFSCSHITAHLVVLIVYSCARACATGNGASVSFRVAHQAWQCVYMEQTPPAAAHNGCMSLCDSLAVWTTVWYTQLVNATCSTCYTSGVTPVFPAPTALPNGCDCSFVAHVEHALLQVLRLPHLLRHLQHAPLVCLSNGCGCLFVSALCWRCCVTCYICRTHSFVAACPTVAAAFFLWRCHTSYTPATRLLHLSHQHRQLVAAW